MKEDIFEESGANDNTKIKQINFLLWFQYVAVVALIVIGLFASASVVTQYYLAVGALIGKLGFDYNTKKRNEL